MVNAETETLKRWVDECAPGRMVFFGGAGVSTESGIPDFRSADGLYSLKYPCPPERMISRSYFDAHPDEFFRFYFDRMIAADAKPNAAHLKLAELEREGKLLAVITQNIDGLHQAAGSRTVYELHGSVLRNCCMKCGERYGLEDVLAMHAASEDGVPRCACGAIVKPEVVLYEEPLDGDVLEAAIRAISRADLMVVAGTSLVVHPAAGLLHYFHGDHLAIVNLSATPADRVADLCIQAKVGEVFSQL